MLDLGPSNIDGLPGLELQFVVETLLLFLLSSIRISSFLMSAPIFGAGYVILPVRIIVSMVVTLIVFSNQQSIVAIEDLSSSTIVIIIMKEIAIGLSAGLILTIIFSAASLAGEKIAGSAGLAMATQVDPNSGASTPVISQILMLFLLVTFLSIDGHLIALRTLIDSYENIPILFFPKLDILVNGGINALGSMFLAASIIMLPVIVILLLVNVAIGIITRSAPTLNLFSFGFPITLLGVFIVLYFSANTIGFAMSDLTKMALESMQEMIGDLSRG